MTAPLPANFNHPKKGSSIKVEPIRDLKAIKQIKKLLKDKPRDLCLFTLGINTAYRANELLSITVGQVAHLEAGDRFELKQSKNNKYRPVRLNRTVILAIRAWLKVHPNPVPEAPLFPSQKGGVPLLVSTVNNLVKNWCAQINLKGNYGSHTLRKTWGTHRLRYERGKKNPLHIMPLLMEAFGHSSQAQTLEYLCIESDEIASLYDMEL